MKKPAWDHDLFDITKSTVTYHRSKDTTRVSADFKDANGISEMKLYLILDRECRKLERRLGISDENPELTH